jgi:hypothetical protein
MKKKKLVQHGIFPEVITVHSWNPAGAEAMVKVLTGGGAKRVIRQPYSKGRHRR